jgi:hypothetical protein
MQKSGYFWLTTETDYVKSCYKCQIYGDKINAPSAPLFNMTSLWAFWYVGFRCHKVNQSQSEQQEQIHFGGH